MDLKLTGKTALVCASSAGIGKAIAHGLAQEGAHVSIFGRSQDRVESAFREISQVAKGRVLRSVGDLRSKDDLSRIFEQTQAQLGPVDVLVNNQGGPAAGKFEDIDDEQLTAGIETNITAVLHLSRLCLPGMRARKWGRIVNVLSISAKEPIPGMFLSNLLRPAILGFAKTIALENAGSGITVNSLLPSAVLTERSRVLLQKRADQEGRDFHDVSLQAASTIPVGYIASPDQFGQTAVFLCSDQAAYITGTAIPIDGGVSKALF